jgi:hypothetical protein
MVGPKITIGNQEVLVDTVTSASNNNIESLDPHLEEFLRQSQKEKIAACIYAKQSNGQAEVRKNLLIIDNRTGSTYVGHYDLNALARVLPPDMRQALDYVFSSQYELIDVTRMLRHEMFHETGGDVRFDGKQLGIHQAVRLVAEKMSQVQNTLQMKHADLSAAAPVVEVVSPSRSGFFNFQGKGKAPAQNPSEKSSRFGLGHRSKDKE